MLIKIDINNSSYNVRIGESISEFGNRLKETSNGNRVVVISNKTIMSYYRDIILLSLEKESFEPELMELEDGEEFKSLETSKKIYDFLCERKIERFTPLIGFGGGVIGDLAGFAASTYLRGLPFYNIPTTLIAQVDSSIGGKTGVNLEYGKNLVGTFYQPVYVHTDVELLETLPEDEYRAGLAEVIKHALIKGELYLKFLEDNIDKILCLDKNVLDEMITESVKVKGEIVMADEKESGIRRILNLGHTVGHAVETNIGYGNIKHGEAVAIGILAAIKIADNTGFCDNAGQLYERTSELINKAGLKSLIPKELDVNMLIATMYHDKKVRNKSLEFVLPKFLGEIVPGIKIEEKDIVQAIEGLYEA